MKQTLQDYKTKKSIVFEQIDLEDAESTQKIKQDLIKLASFYCNYFNHFSETFFDSQEEKIDSIIQKNRTHFEYLILPLQKMQSSSEFVKDSINKKITKYVMDNKKDIDNFINLCESIATKPTSIQEELKNIDLGEDKKEKPGEQDEEE